MKESLDFERIVIDKKLEKAYQVSMADLNGDGLSDLIAVSTKLPEVFWYENPTWKKHIISKKLQGNIDIAPKDINGDGQVDLALATDFNFNKSEIPGRLCWLENTGQGQEWSLHLIDSSSVPHRIRWADIDGDLQDELVNVPIMGYKAKGPNYQESVEMAYYEIPMVPESEYWSKSLIDTTLEMVHGIQVVDWNQDPYQDLLTASFEGIFLHQPVFAEQAISWKKTHLGTGDLSVRPNQGSSEIGVGFLGEDQSPFLATIEPWHGHQVVLYRKDQSDGFWDREIIDTTFNDGHALLTSDLNGDGNSEIIAGHRGSGYHLFIYEYNDEADGWIRTYLDRGQMSAAGLFICDIDGDDLLDIVCAGSNTNNLILYRNLGN